MRAKEMFRKITKKNPKPNNRERFLASINDIIIIFWNDFLELRKLRRPETDLAFFKLFDDMNQKANALRARLKAFYKVDVLKLNLFSEILKQQAPETYAAYMAHREKEILARMKKDSDALEEDIAPINEGPASLKLVK